MYRSMIVAAIALGVAGGAFAAGEAEGGRDVALDIVEEGSYVAPSYVDLERVLDDYSFPYEAAGPGSLSVYLDVLNPLVPDWGGSTTLQVSLLTAGQQRFAQVAVDYIVFAYSKELFEQSDMRAALGGALAELLEIRESDQAVWIYFRKEREVVEVTDTRSVARLLERAAEQIDTPTIQDALRRRVEAERDLRLLLEAGAELPGDRPRKYLWILDKPIADTAGDLRDVAAIIAGYGDTDTEVSFLGHGDSFRAETVNTFVSRFGGNSYYARDAADLHQTIIDDFAFYRRPAVGDLRIEVHSLGAVPSAGPIRVYALPSVGCDEPHVFMTTLAVPSRLEYTQRLLGSMGQYAYEDVEARLEEVRSYPLAYVTIRYDDHATGERVHEYRTVSVSYTQDYAKLMEARNPTVERNLAIMDTFRLLGDVADNLRYGNYIDPLLEINDHIRRLERLNDTVGDELIAEDVAMLRDYKATIRENRDSPLRGLKTWREIGRRRY